MTAPQGRYLVEVDLSTNDEVKVGNIVMRQRYVEVLADALTGDQEARLVACQMAASVDPEYQMPTDARIIQLIL